MTAQNGFHAMEGAEFLRGDKDPDVRAANECRTIGGVHFCAAQELGLGHIGAQAENDTGVGLIFVTRRGGDHGLSVALTPKAMRGLSNALLKMADMVDANAAATASAALNKAAGK
jgi:hypothetical protein